MRRKRLRGPGIVFIVLTEKGRGYEPAPEAIRISSMEQDRLDIKTGKAFIAEKKEPTYNGCCFADANGEISVKRHDMDWSASLAANEKKGTGLVRFEKT